MRRLQSLPAKTASESPGTLEGSNFHGFLGADLASTLGLQPQATLDDNSGIRCIMLGGSTGFSLGEIQPTNAI